jgi:predicted Zn-dependent protease
MFAQNQANVERGIDSYSREKEAALGNKLANEIRQRTTSIQNPTSNGFVERLGRRLAAHMPEAKLDFTFSIIAEDPCPTVHEPVALSGGYVFVPAALFLAAQDESEFAGMLAHAMAHIADRHGMQLFRRDQPTGLADAPLVFVGAWGGSCTQGLAIPMGLVATERGFEQEADARAVRTMAQAGFDPDALVRYTERVQPASSSTTSAAFAIIPPRDERVAAMTSTIESLPATNYPGRVDSEFAAAREQVRRALPMNTAAPPPSLRRKMP